MTTVDSYPLVDLELSRRLERAEALSNVAFVEARARLQPQVGAQWIEVDGARAMFDGVGSPLTQTFGLGVFEPATHRTLDAIEAFYERLGAPALHEVSPLGAPALLDVLSDRGYRPVELTSVMFRPIRAGLDVARPRNERVHVRIIGPADHDRWARTAADGWSDTPGLSAILHGLMQISVTCSGQVSFLAEIDGQPIATGGLNLSGGVALLAGASTIPAARQQGAQLALLNARLRYAAELGHDIAMMGALPGSGSQRNAERQGFRIAYTRIKWGPKTVNTTSNL